MTYCSSSDLPSVPVVPAADLTLIIAEADREIAAYLLPYDLQGGGDDTVKEAAIKLCKAGIFMYSWASGDVPKLLVTGDKRIQGDPEVAIKILRDEAFALLHLYVESQIVRINLRRSFVRVVNGQ